MKRKNWVRSLVSLLLVCSLVLGMAGTANAEKSKKSKKKELQWTEEEGVGTPGIAAQKQQEPKETSEKESKQVRVFIVLNGSSALESGFSAKGLFRDERAQSFLSEARAQQQQTISQIQRAVNPSSFDVRYQFTVLTNAVSAVVQYKDIEKIKEVEGVNAVYIVPEYYLQDTAEANTATAGEMVGSYQTWDSGYTGAGQKIAIVDTGIDVSHPSFDSGAFAHGRKETETRTGRVVTEELLDAEDIAKVLDQLKISQKQDGLSPQSLCINEKIPFAYNYVDQDLNISDEEDHGTHVAGIAAANKYVPEGNGTYHEQPEGVAGIAKDAQLLVMKVFGDNGGAYTDDYMAAIEDALLLDVDVINLSMGTPNPGESSAYSGEAYVNEILKRLQGSDMVVSISAGNSGSWAENSKFGHNRTEDVNMNMIGNPGSYTNALTVASAINGGYTGCGFQLGKQTFFYGETGSQDKIPSMASLDTSGNGTDYPYVFLNSAGEAQNYQGVDVKGKIVFVNKGTISYAQKHENAQAAGAAALFICNDEYGFPKIDLSGSKATIPCAILAWEDSWELQNYQGDKIIRMLSKPAKNFQAAEGYGMSDYSAWGVPGDLSLKPEITAPGENIYSTKNNGGYGSLSGTSMAAPSIAGMSALVSDYIKRNDLENKTGLSSRTLTQSLLMSTSVPLKEKDNEEYSPRKQGSGIANVKAATSTPVYVLVGEKEGNDGKVKAELGDDPNKGGEYTFDFNLFNISGKNQYYSLKSSIMTEQVEEGEWFQGSSHKLQPQVTYTSQNVVLFYDLNGDQKVDTADALELLKHINGSVRLERVESSQEKFDFNGDGVLNTVDVYRFLREFEQPTMDLQERKLEVKDQAKVNVKVVLSESDKNYLDTYFKNGMYIDGFIYLKGAVELSIPMLAFYGNWTESSMFEPFDYLTFCNNGEKAVAEPYSTIEKTNYLNYYAAEEENEYCYASNMYLEGGDDAYLPDRNAFSTESGDQINSAVYTLIRNAATVRTSVTNADTGEVYYEVLEENIPGAYYDSEENEWRNTQYSSNLDWKGLDANGKPLPEGTKVQISVTALPEYYKDKWNEAAKGASFSVPITIDNTKPELVDVQDIGSGKLELTIQDNRYTAAVQVYGKDKETLIKTYGVNQTEAGIPMKVTIKDPKKVFYLSLVDYAGNTISYRVNRSGTPDTSITDGVTLDQSELKLIKGNTKQLKAVVSPESILDDTVTWSSENPEIADVDKEGVVTGIAPGTTKIIAATNAKNAAGEPETAECQVTVEEIAVSLNGIVWDGNGSTYFNNFNTAALSELHKLSGKQKNNYMAATAVEDAILAAVNDTVSENQKSELFLIDPDDKYKAVSKASIDWCPVDLAYSPNTGLVFGIDDTYVRWFDSETTEKDQGAVDLGGHTLSDKLVGITYAGYTDEKKYGPVEWFYVVSQNGGMLRIGYIVTEEGFIYQDLGSTGINTGNEWEFNSLYYDKESGYIFWSVNDGSGIVKLYALEETYDPDKKTVNVTASLLGNFAEDIWPVIGLYGTSDLDGHSFPAQLQETDTEPLFLPEAERDNEQDESVTDEGLQQDDSAAENENQQDESLPGSEDQQDESPAGNESQQDQSPAGNESQQNQSAEENIDQ